MSECKAYLAIGVLTVCFVAAVIYGVAQQVWHSGQPILTP